jgi:8-oxo-dGTP pyrophosphatase MutT (NUDIX family)
MEKLTEKTFPLYSDSVDSSHLMWTEKSRRKLLETPIFDVNGIERESTDGRKGMFVEIKTPQWINVIPVFTGTDGKRYFIMERQFRHGSQTVTLEFPAGLVEEGEDPEKAALRELLEETGIKAGKLTQTGLLNPNSAFMCTKGYFYVAQDLEYTGERHFDANEEIETVTISEDEVFKRMGKGEMDNGIMMVAAFLYLKFRGEI